MHPNLCHQTCFWQQQNKPPMLRFGTWKVTMARVTGGLSGVTGVLMNSHAPLPQSQGQVAQHIHFQCLWWLCIGLGHGPNRATTIIPAPFLDTGGDEVKGLWPHVECDSFANTCSHETKPGIHYSWPSAPCVPPSSNIQFLTGASRPDHITDPPTRWLPLLSPILSFHLGLPDM